MNINLNSIAVNATALETRLLGVDTVSQISLTKSIIIKALSLKAAQYQSFNPTGLLEFPKSATAIRGIGIVAMTATFMLNKECNDFVFCNEDMATAVNSKIESSKFYRFLHGGAIDPKDTSKGTDLIIKPDGLVCTLFDINSEDGASDEMIVKTPRTVEELRAEIVSNEVKANMAAKLNFSVFPHLTSKSYYSSNSEAAEELELTRQRVAKALARSNSKAAQGQMCQALILGVVSHFHVMSSMYYSSLKLQAEGKDVKTAPFGLGIYMPAWTILSKDIIRPISGELDKLKGLTGYNNRPAVLSRKATYSALGLPMPKKDVVRDLMVESSELIESLKEKPLKEMMNEMENNPKENKILEDTSPIKENVSHDCEPEKETNKVKELWKNGMNRKRMKQVNNDPLGLNNLPPVAEKSIMPSAPVAEEPKKEVEKSRRAISADDDVIIQKG